MEKFYIWVGLYNPDTISRLVIAKLYECYIQGDPIPLFGKMAQLEEHELYTICSIFKSFFEYVNINNDYKTWLDRTKWKM